MEIQFFSIKDMHCPLVLIYLQSPIEWQFFLPKLVDMLLFSTEVMPPWPWMECSNWDKSLRNSELVTYTAIEQWTPTNDTCFQFYNEIWKTGMMKVLGIVWKTPKQDLLLKGNVLGWSLHCEPFVLFVQCHMVTNHRTNQTRMPKSEEFKTGLLQIRFLVTASFLRCCLRKLQTHGWENLTFQISLKMKLPQTFLKWKTIVFACTGAFYPGAALKSNPVYQSFSRVFPSFMSKPW